MRYAIVKDGIVENTVEWDGETPWSPPEGATAHAYPEGPISIGWEWADGAPVVPIVPDP